MHDCEWDCEECNDSSLFIKHSDKNACYALKNFVGANIRDI